ncbi:MAG: NADPH-dependent F420 reductase [Candidatus Dormiibacterota bacterium]|jgi:NADPH-dependent F420 reductase
MNESALSEVGLIGGTGPLGRGMAARLAAAGLTVRLGSRDLQRANEIAASVQAQVGPGRGTVVGASNLDAAGSGQLTLLTVPYEAGAPLLAQLGAELQGRVLISTAAPMEFRRGVPYPVRPEAGSAALEAAQHCPGALVVAAFHTVSASTLERLESPLDEDVIVTSDDATAKDLVVGLVRTIAGLRPVDGGGLANSHFSEALTPFLIRLNRIHRAETGIRITGLDSH